MSNSLQQMPLLMIAGTNFDNKEPLLDYAGVDYKALIDINGKTIITRMLEEFVKSETVSHYFIVGIPENLVKLPSGIEKVHFVETDELRVPGRINDSCKLMLEMSKTDPTVFPSGNTKIMLMGADVPFIKAEIIRDFQSKLLEDRDLHISIVEAKYMNESYPHNNRTFAKLYEGRYCMGDLSCFSAALVEDRMPQITTFRENRKHFYRVILRLRPTIVLRYFFNRLTINFAEGSVDKVFRLRSQIIPMKHPGIGFDIDKPEQLEIARKQLA